MTCETCGSQRLDKHLSCAVCLLRVWRRESWEKVRRGDLPIHIHDRGRHLRLPGDNETLCGKPNKALGWSTATFHLADEWQNPVCRECTQQLKQHAPEIEAAYQARIEEVARRADRQQRGVA